MSGSGGSPSCASWPMGSASGRTEELLRVLEMMHAHAGPDEEVLRELATICVRCGQPRRALIKLEALLRIAPDDRLALERLARVHASLGRQEISLRLLERLVALLVDEHADRGELRTMLRRVASWSSDEHYERAIDQLAVRALRPGGGPVGQAARPPRRLGSGDRVALPPLPRSSRAPARAARAGGGAGEIHVLDSELLVELDDAVTQIS